MASNSKQNTMDAAVGVNTATAPEGEPALVTQPGPVQGTEDAVVREPKVVEGAYGIKMIVR